VLGGRRRQARGSWWRFDRNDGFVQGCGNSARDNAAPGLAVISHLRDGKPNKLIARELAICEGPIKIYIRRIMKKLRVENRTQAALVATNLQLAG
jgi:DNA-binding CsgD family transcriptional regulator